MTDHRIDLDLSALPRVMDGDIDRLIDALVMADQAERLAAITGGDRWRSAEPDAAATARRRRHRRATRRRPAGGPRGRARRRRAVARPRSGGTDRRRRRPLRRAARRPDPEGDRPRQRPGPQARQPVPADRPVRRHPPRLARAGPVPVGHAGSSRAASLRVGGDAAGPPAGLDGGELPRLDPADEPERRPQPGREDAARTSAGRRADARDRPRPADRRRGDGRAGPDRQPRRARRARVAVELELGADDADIFEVRGYPRPERGTLLPIAADRDPGDVPLRRPRRPPPVDPRRLLRAGDAVRRRSTADPTTRSRAAARPLPLGREPRAGRARTSCSWTIWPSITAEAASERDRRRTATRRVALPRAAPGHAATTAPARTTPGAAARPRSRPTTSCST